jgi:hypothetical protein
MIPFLKLVADDLYKDFGKDISNLTLVFPSRRASLFFNKYLSENLESPIWLPATTTISDLMYEISGLKQSDSLLLIVKLYQIYLEKLHTLETFDSFYFWGEVMLADFDQVDKYRVDASILFTNILDIKEIDERFGGFTPEQIEALKTYLGVITDSNNSIIKDRYLSIWKVLGSIYNDFRSSLLQDGLSYEGLAYGVAASKLDENQQLPLNGTFVFIGFNALNECEKALFRYLKKSKNAIFYWDFDLSYAKSELHEASFFIRDNLLEFENKLSSTLFDSFKEESKIHLIAAPTGVTQAKLLPQILSQLTVETPVLNINTAIVLPEEHLLLPVLSALPESTGDLNITMGYPLQETAAYNLAEFIIKLHINSRTDDQGIVRFYHRDVLSLLNHPYLQIIDPDGCNLIISRIKSQNIIFVDTQDLEKLIISKDLFVNQSTGSELASHLVEMSKLVAGLIIQKSNVENFNSRIELEYLYSLYTNLNRLVDVINQNNIEISLKIFRQLFRKAFAQVRVSFSGEPLSGLQIMGFLETRTLDFENLIMLSVNDDVLPGNHHRPSFVTPSLRFAYGLPDYSHQNAIYGYYFYRLLQRSKNVYLVYRNRAEGLMSGELSRFALQLLMESGKKIEKIDIKFDLGISTQQDIIIEKTENVVKKLNRYTSDEESKKYLSPSAFTTYLSCPLKFYYRYVADIREAEEVTEEVDLPGFGKILHAAMDLIYTSIGKETIEQVDLEKLVNNPKKLDSLIETAFAKEYLKSTKDEIKSTLAGRNLLVLEQIKYAIVKMLKTDIKRTPFKIIKMEEEVRANLQFRSNGRDYQLRIGGIVDRLETDGDTVKVVDYKTGNAKDKGEFSSLDDFFDSKKSDKTKEVFQIFTYCYGLKQQDGFSDIKPELWFIRNTSSDYMPKVVFSQGKSKTEVISYNQWEAGFVDRLKLLASDIFDASKPFEPITDLAVCRKCPYISICGRR